LKNRKFQNVTAFLRCVRPPRLLFLRSALSRSDPYFIFFFLIPFFFYGLFATLFLTPLHPEFLHLPLPDLLLDPFLRFLRFPPKIFFSEGVQRYRVLLSRRCATGAAPNFRLSFLVPFRRSRLRKLKFLPNENSCKAHPCILNRSPSFLKNLPFQNQSARSFC